MNSSLLPWVSVALVLCNMYLLATSRITGLIRGVAVQGFLLGILPVLMPGPPEVFHIVVLVVLGITVKGVLIPRYLFRAIRDIRELHGLHPRLGVSLSLLYGALVSSLAFAGLHLPAVPRAVISPFHAATAVATAAIGLFLIVTSRNVVRQIVGYIVLENATFIFGVSLAAFQPLFVEMGVLLDMLGAVFIMMVAVDLIHGEHATINVDSLEKLTR